MDGDPLQIGARVFLSEDARLWMRDIGVRPGKVVAMSSDVAQVEFWGIEGRSLVPFRNLEVVENG